MSYDDYVVHEETYRGCKITISQDNDYWNYADPKQDFNGDDDILLVNWHNDWTIERPDIISKDEAVDWYHDKPIPQSKKYHIWELSTFSHSGVALHLGRGYFETRGDAGGWDTSYVGLVLVSKKLHRTIKAAKKAALAHVELWDDLAHNNIASYSVESSTGNDVDSCGGFIGDYDSKGGCLDQAREAAERYEQKRKAEQAAQVKAYVKHKVPLEKRQKFQI